MKLWEGRVKKMYDWSYTTATICICPTIFWTVITTPILRNGPNYVHWYEEADWVTTKSPVRQQAIQSIADKTPSLFDTVVFDGFNSRYNFLYDIISL